MRISTAFLLATLPFCALAVEPAKAPADPAAEYAARAEKLGEKDAKGWLKLADFCEEHLLWDKRIEALRKAVTIDPDNAEAHARLDEVKSGPIWMIADLADQKEAEEKKAKDLVRYGKKWVSPKEADKLREADRKSEGWNLETRLDTPHLAIYSSQSLAFTEHLAAILEGEVVLYQRLYGKVWKLDPNAKPFKVYVFGDRPTFVRVLGAAAGSRVSDLLAGQYVNTTHILYVGFSTTQDGSDPDMTLAVSAHEITHAMDDLLAHCFVGVLDWVEEGRADYFGYAVQGRRVLPGVVHIPSTDTVAMVLEESLPHASLSTLLSLPEGAFMRDANALEEYALAWAWVHFLFHGDGGKHAAAFKTFLAGLPQKGAKADFEKAVGKLADLEPAFKSYVQQTLLPATREPDQKKETGDEK